MNQKQIKQFLIELRAQREKMKLDQTEFGAYFGMDRPNYCRLENGGLKTIPRAYPVILTMLQIIDLTGRTALLNRKLDALRS